MVHKLKNYKKGENKSLPRTSVPYLPSFYPSPTVGTARLLVPSRNIYAYEIKVYIFHVVLPFISLRLF